MLNISRGDLNYWRVFSQDNDLDDALSRAHLSQPHCQHATYFLLSVVSVCELCLLNLVWMMMTSTMLLSSTDPHSAERRQLHARALATWANYGMVVPHYKAHCPKWRADLLSPDTMEVRC